MKRTIDLAGRAALITGASAGIGAALARVLARDAALLVLVARRRERLDALAAELTAARPGLRVLVRAVDLTDRAATGAMLDALDADGVRVDVLVNNAGFGDRGLFEARGWAKIEKMLELNVVGATFLLHRLLPGMVERGRGAVLNVGSIAGIVTKPGSAVYGASKSYLNALSDALGAELAGTGVTVTAVLPGPVPTEFQEVAEGADAAPRAEGARAGAKGPDAAGMKLPAALTVTAAQCAEEAVAALKAGQARVVPGVSTRAFAALLSGLPRAVTRGILERAARRLRAG